MKKDELEMYKKQVIATIESIQQPLVLKDKRRISCNVYYHYLEKCKGEAKNVNKK